MAELEDANIDVIFSKGKKHDQVRRLDLGPDPGSANAGCALSGQLPNLSGHWVPGSPLP